MAILCGLYNVSLLLMSLIHSHLYLFIPYSCLSPSFPLPASDY